MEHKEHDMCCMPHGGGHLFVTLGFLAFVYGVVNYLRMTYTWPPYAGWIVGGLVLVIFGLAKKNWCMKK